MLRRGSLRRRQQRMAGTETWEAAQQAVNFWKFDRHQRQGAGFGQE